jgi:transposase
MCHIDFSFLAIVSTLHVPAFPHARALPALSRVCEGHNQAFAYFEGAPRSILYDDTKIAIAEITGDGERKPTG